MDEINSSIKLKKTLLKNKNICFNANYNNSISEATFVDSIAYALKEGANIIQFGKNIETGAKIIDLGKKIRQLCSIFNALFIVDERIDIALALDADGVHLNKDSIDIKLVKTILDKDKLISYSPRNIQEAFYAIENKADYNILLSSALNLPFKEYSELRFYKVSKTNPEIYSCIV